MLIEHRGKRPDIAASALISSTAVVSGDVTIAHGVRVLHGAIITAEDGAIHIGENTVVMENAVIRGRESHPVAIGRDVMIGPHSHINGATIGDEAFIATGASLFPGAVIGDGAEVRINAVVQVNTVVDAGLVVPIAWVAVGNPAQLFSPDRHDEIWAVQRTLDFVGTVYGIKPGDGMPAIMRKQSDWFGSHANDSEVE